MTDGPMRIDLWSDLVCPWCYVGKARLDRAIEAAGMAGRVDVAMRAFELDPTASRAPEKVLDMLAGRYRTSRDHAAAMEDRVGGLARAEGLPFVSDRSTANTFDIHRVVALASARGVGTPVFDALQRGLFGGTADPWDPATLRGVAEEAGIPGAEVDAVLAAPDRFAAEVRTDEALAGRIGITGVPFAAIDMAVGVPGAQSVEVFVEALRTAEQRRAEDASGSEGEPEG